MCDGSLTHAPRAAPAVGHLRKRILAFARSVYLSQLRPARWTASTSIGGAESTALPARRGGSLTPKKLSGDWLCLSRATNYENPPEPCDDRIGTVPRRSQNLCRKAHGAHRPRRAECLGARD